jgi:hypothetical protein
MADLSQYSDAELERMANAQSLAHLSDADLEKIAGGQKKPGIGDSIVDAIRSIPGGLTKGVTGLVGLPGTLFNPTETEVVEGLGGEPITVNKGANRGLPTGEGIDRAVSAPFGGYYQPKTTPGQITERIGEFAPSVIGGPASLGTRFLGRVVAPALGSVAAENAVHSDNAGVRAAAQIGGALLGAGAFGGARALSQAVKNAKLSPEQVAGSFASNIAQSAGPMQTIAGRGQTAAEALGPTGVANLAALGRRGGETGRNLAEMLKQRSADAPSRIMSDYETSAGIHPDAAQGSIDALVEAGQKRAAPLFKDALESKPAVHTDELAELMTRPVVKKAMATAANDLRNAGKDPGAIGLHFDEAGNVTQRIDPTPEAWDLTRKAMNRTVERDPFGNRIPDSKSPGNYNISKATGELTGALKKAIPGYSEALAESGDYLSLKSAFEAGQKHILDTGTTAKQVADHLSDMTAAEKEAYAAGIGNKIFNQTQNSRLRPAQLLTPSVQAKLESALGAQKAKDFVSGLQGELSLAQSGGRMMPGTNSITSDVLNAGREQDLADTIRGASHFAHAAGNFAAGRYGAALGNALRGTMHLAPDLLRTGGMSEEARNAAGRLLMLPPEDFVQQLKALPAPQPGIGAAALAPYLLRKNP